MEFVELEAEIVDQQLAPRPDYAPAVIDAQAYLNYTSDRLTQLMEPYQNMDTEALLRMEPKEVKACRADVNAIIRDIEDQRKTIKRAYMEPYNAFEQQIKELLEPAREAAEQLKGVVDQQTEARKQLRREGLENTYNDYAPALVPVVPFERILETKPEWMNLSYSSSKAAEEICELVNKIAHDWSILKGQANSLAFYDEAEAEFFRTLDLGKALELNEMRAAEQARIDELRAEVEANQAAQKEPEEIAPEPLEINPQAVVERVPYVISIDLYEGEKMALMAWIQENEIGANRTIGRKND